MSGWKHRVLEDATGLPELPPAMAPYAAQFYCNFVVWTPTSVPAGCELAVGTLRMEAPPGRVEGHSVGRTPWCENNPAAYRFEVSGPGRRLRVKQFLYDWTFPALDHPSLWESETRAVALDGQDVVWFGVDYMKKRAASARLSRTMVELSVLDGEFTDAEIVDLFRSLRPADLESATTITATPFAALSYWARRSDAVKLTVPIGLWHFRRRQEHTSRWSTGAEAQRLVAPLGLPSALGGCQLDSVGVFRDDQGREETEVIYAGGHDRGREVRVIAQRAGQGSLIVPAEVEADQPGLRSVQNRLGIDVQLGWIDERYGPFQAVLATDEVELCLLTSTGVGLDRSWFLDIVDTLVKG